MHKSRNIEVWASFQFASDLGIALYEGTQMERPRQIRYLTDCLGYLHGTTEIYA